ncbi:hypothetical protein GCK72_020309 [Caenorhabditis remanei]|uniref:T20D4.11-like domain-containing protein n=1 Tax=Caenorhabditis remanei TaxID=31234 RepID=A0A6A5GGW1_CAERE|nr:hypothetical protein GCK72_020309 [Caenorhabditis remanei]KAF1753752.1 hypothetical protein GCK72_020309 [Caenorhabditis remanei]
MTITLVDLETNGSLEIAHTASEYKPLDVGHWCPMWKLCKILLFIFLSFLALLCLFFALSIGYISAIVFLPTWFPVQVNKLAKGPWNLEDTYDVNDPNIKLSPWGQPYDSECGMVRMIFLEMDCLVPANKCLQKIEMFEKEKNIGKFHNISNYCFEAATCMRMMACREGEYHYTKFHKYPHNFFMNHSSLPICMTKFYKAVQEESFDNCTREFQFLSKDPILKNHAYFHGKFCFQEFSRLFCETEVVDYLDRSYEYFLELALIPTKIGCGIYEKFEALECQDTMDTFKKSVEILKLGNQTREDYKNVAIICDEMQNCFSNLTSKCAISSEFLKTSNEYCEKIHFLSSPFWQCLSRMKKENTQPDLLKYTCFIGHQFDDDSMACLRFRDSAVCVKDIMMDHCGMDSVDNFEYFRSYVLEMWDC